MFIYDAIKIKYINEGYLPNYPYHLVSDEEMCDAFLDYGEDSDDNWENFLNNSSSFFALNYPLLSDGLETPYRELVIKLSSNIAKLKESNLAVYVLPAWVCSYMLGQVISINSDKLDIHDFLVMLGADNIEDDYTATAGQKCYEISSKLLKHDTTRVPSMFGELNVQKYLRLKSADLL